MKKNIQIFFNSLFLHSTSYMKKKIPTITWDCNEADIYIFLAISVIFFSVMYKDSSITNVYFSSCQNLLNGTRKFNKAALYLVSFCFIYRTFHYTDTYYAYKSNNHWVDHFQWVLIETEENFYSIRNVDLNFRYLYFT